ESYPNLIRIDQPIDRISLRFFSRRTDIAIDKWKSDTPYSIGIVRGALGATDLTLGMDPIVPDDPLAHYRMLDSGRLALGIVPQDNGPLYAIMAGVSNVTAVGQPLSTLDMFHYLNAKNAGLAPNISRVLRRMSETGELAGLRRRALDQIYHEARSTPPSG